MNLAIFDLDGTLTETNAVDTECFVAAWKTVHGIDCTRLSWSSFTDVTDHGIAAALCERHFAEEERRSAYEAMKSAFLALLAQAACEQPEGFRAVPGAVDLLAYLQSGGWAAAVATGAWAGSARIKLAAAGFPPGIPLAASDDHPRRTDIVQAAIDLAARRYSCDFQRVVLIGDAPWDVAAAAALRLPFVGRAAASASQALRTAGATTVLEDFTDRAAAERALVTAEVPSSPDRGRERREDV